MIVQGGIYVRNMIIYNNFRSCYHNSSYKSRILTQTEAISWKLELPYDFIYNNTSGNHIL